MISSVYNSIINLTIYQHEKKLYIEEKSNPKCHLSIYLWSKLTDFPSFCFYFLY